MRPAPARWNCFCALQALPNKRPTNLVTPLLLPAMLVLPLRVLLSPYMDVLLQVSTLVLLVLSMLLLLQLMSVRLEVLGSWAPTRSLPLIACPCCCLVMCTSSDRRSSTVKEPACKWAHNRESLSACASPMCRVGQSRLITPYMTVYLVNPLLKLPYVHRIYIIYFRFWPTLLM